MLVCSTLPRALLLVYPVTLYKTTNSSVLWLPSSTPMFNEMLFYLKSKSDLWQAQPQNLMKELPRPHLFIQKYSIARPTWIHGVAPEHSITVEAIQHVTSIGHGDELAFPSSRFLFHVIFMFKFIKHLRREWFLKSVGHRNG